MRAWRDQGCVCLCVCVFVCVCGVACNTWCECARFVFRGLCVLAYAFINARECVSISDMFDKSTLCRENSCNVCECMDVVCVCVCVCDFTHSSTMWEKHVLKDPRGRAVTVMTALSRWWLRPRPDDKETVTCVCRW